jgi:hypothetical protein
MALGRQARSLSSDNEAIVSRIYFAKCLVVLFFALLPLAITINYGLIADVGKEDCKQPKRVAAQG